MIALVSQSLTSTATTISSIRNITTSSSSSDSNSKPRRGFGTPPTTKKQQSKTTKEEKSPALQLKKRNRNSNSMLAQPTTTPTQAPGLNSRKDGSYKNTSIDLEFEERLKAVSRSAAEQKKANEMKEFGAIDYDTPIETEDKTIGLGTKIGVGVAVVIFGLVFALGDFLPSGSDIPSEDAVVSQKKLSDEEKSILQTRLKEFEAALSSSPRDLTALEGAAVTLAELGEYKAAASQLEELVKEKPEDLDVFCLLGEVKFELKDYEGSAVAYRRSAKLSTGVNFELLRGLTNSLLAAKKPHEAVQVILASRNQLKFQKSEIKPESSSSKTDLKVDPIQVDLLLGKAYSDWGHISDAASVYDGIISSNPDDFRGYLAKVVFSFTDLLPKRSHLNVGYNLVNSVLEKGILLKENGNAGEAERMFIQIRSA